MADKSNISWTDATWGPLYGCSKVSQGCKHCYAIEVVAGLARKFRGKPQEQFYSDLVKDGNWTGVVKLHEEHLLQPLRWQKPRRIFVNSLSDLFHESVSDEIIERVFCVMALAHWHTFQILTKRSERMQKMLSSPSFWERLSLGASLLNANWKHEKNLRLGKSHPGISWPLPNVWLGVSVENQEAADERIPLLLQTPAKVRFLSCEPLLGNIDLENYPCPDCFGQIFDGKPMYCNWMGCELEHQGQRRNDLSQLHWVIVGGESGPNFRPMQQEWARSLRDQCKAADIPFFFKQDADRRAGQRPCLVEKDGSMSHYQQFPGEKP